MSVMQDVSSARNTGLFGVEFRDARLSMVNYTTFFMISSHRSR